MGSPERCARRPAEVPSASPAAARWVTLDDTAAFAAALARDLPDGQIVLLDGPLGAGKTTFVAALVRALGSEADVSSPSYTLMHEYPSASGPLVHVDLYRLPENFDVEATLDLEGALERARAVLIEWGGRLAQRLPDAWWLEIERDEGGRLARWRDGRGPRQRPEAAPPAERS